MPGPCMEPGCTTGYVGMRFFCDTNTCPGPAFGTALVLRCPECRNAHDKQWHGREPEHRSCRCGEPLGEAPKLYSPAGAPWCGACRPWWHGV